MLWCVRLMVCKCYAINPKSKLASDLKSYLQSTVVDTTIIVVKMFVFLVLMFSYVSLCNPICFEKEILKYLFVVWGDLELFF